MTHWSLTDNTGNQPIASGLFATGQAVTGATTNVTVDGGTIAITFSSTMNP